MEEKKTDEIIAEEEITEENNAEETKPKKKKLSKKAKIILFTVIGVVVLAAAAVGIVLALKESDTAVTGTVTEGSGTYEWRKTETHISLGSRSEDKFYTNCNGDYITDVYFRKVVDNKITRYRISYNQDFNISDDLNTFFVLTDGTHTFTTRVETSHFAFSVDEIHVRTDEIDDNYYIKEVWVQTED